MYLIEGHWESINNVSDIVRIIRDNYNYELADILQEIGVEDFKEEKKQLEYDISELENELEWLQNENNDLYHDNNELRTKIKELEDKISELEDSL